MVGLVDRHRCLYGMCLGLQGERHTHGCCHWHCCPCRFVGSFGHSEKPIHGQLCFMHALHHDLTSFQELFWRHFAARAIGLIVIPLFVYLSFFWIHFTILTHSGTGHSFMSPHVPESLAGNELLMNSIGKGLLPPKAAMHLHVSQSLSIMILLLCDTRIPRCSYTLIPNVTHCVMRMAGSVARVWRACSYYLCNAHV